VTSVLTVLYDTDTCAIHLPTSELSSNTNVYANTLSLNLLTYLTYFTYLLTCKFLLTQRSLVANNSNMRHDVILVDTAYFAESADFC